MISAHSWEDHTTIVREIQGDEGVEFLYVPHDDAGPLKSYAVRVYEDGAQCIAVTLEGAEEIVCWRPDECADPQENAEIIEGARDS